MLELRERLDFNADEFVNLPRRERSEICILLAERAQEIGMKAQPVQRQIFLNIASQWLHLAGGLAPQRSLAFRRPRPALVRDRCWSQEADAFGPKRDFITCVQLFRNAVSLLRVLRGL